MSRGQNVTKKTIQKIHWFYFIFTPVSRGQSWFFVDRRGQSWYLVRPRDASLESVISPIVPLRILAV